jgi:hypothetical protein
MGLHVYNGSFVDMKTFAVQWISPSSGSVVGGGCQRQRWSGSCPTSAPRREAADFTTAGRSLVPPYQQILSIVCDVASGFPEDLLYALRVIGNLSTEVGCQVSPRASRAPRLVASERPYLWIQWCVRDQHESLGFGTLKWGDWIWRPSAVCCCATRCPSRID